jgi:RHS repeat-associated protein
VQYHYGGYEHTGDGTAGTMAQYSIPAVVIDRPGYIYVYCSFENTTTTDYAFFDDLSVRTSRSVVQADDYYPFGLTFNSYSSGTKNNYLFNAGSELDPATGNYETLFRGYDPALGRFMQIDPMADFFPGINPYNFAFNNPISLMDPYGLGPFDGIVDFFKRLFNGFVGDGASKQARRSQRKNNAVGVARSRGKGKGRSGGSSSTQSQNDDTPPTQYALIYLEPKRPSYDPGQPSFPDINPIPPTPTPPVFKNTPIPARTKISYSEHINFTPKTDRFDSYSTTQSQLAELTNLLLKYPEISVFVVGNVGVPENSGLILGNSKAALDQDGFGLNGSTGTARSLMNARARAVYQFLIQQGVDPKQLN